MKTKIKNKELLIFDFDGTIVDSSPIHEKSFQEALRNENFAVDYELLKGMSTKDAILKIFNQNNLSLSNERLMELIVKKQSLSKKYFSAISLIDGFDEFHRLAKSIFRLSIVSSASRASIDIALKKFNLEKGFDLIISSESVEKTKPNPEGFLQALNKFKISTEKTLIFEDSFAGFLAAEKAGIDCIDVTKTSWSSLVNKIK